ncbi:5-(carboxyamino)imidazole ribonucleotide mutase [Magnetococcales bacterium HHB-1]
MSDQPVVGILMGSDSDWSVMQEAAKVLKAFSVPFEVMVTSAHRTPERTHAYASQAREKGIKTLIIGAGAAAHLAGVVASETTLPIIAVPLAATDLKGMDALLATVMMPGGVPVASMAIGKAGAKNGALFAIQILSLSDDGLAKKFREYRLDMVDSVTRKDAALQEKLAAL